MLCKPQIFFLRSQLLNILGIRPPSVFYIGGSDNLPAPLPRPEEEQALASLAEGDEAARKCLIEHNLRLVVFIAKRFENTGVSIEDLISIGTIGLIKAVNTFQADKNIKLATYASRCIENEILMHLRKISAQRAELSFDEPLNTDWDGNELLLSDVLGTDEDEVSRPLEDDAERRMLTESGKSRSFCCASVCPTARSIPRRRWRICWGSPRATSAAWKSGSSSACAGKS